MRAIGNHQVVERHVLRAGKFECDAIGIVAIDDGLAAAVLAMDRAARASGVQRTEYVNFSVDIVFGA